MRHRGPLLCLLTCMTFALPLPAQTGKDTKKEDDVVIDNRARSKQREIKEGQTETTEFESDTPFGGAAPDPRVLREERWKPGVGWGFRLGFAFPMGDYSGNAKLSQVADGLIFLGGEVGYWFLPQLFTGVALSGGYMLPDCSDDASCMAWQLRGGPLVLWRVAPFSNLTPFFGVGAGYEWITFNASTDTISANTSAHGFEYVNLQAGLDVRSRTEIYGVFVSWSLGTYTKYSSSVESDLPGFSKEESGSIEDPKTHSWLGIGVRGTFE